jgi:uncharacterized membrane protein
MGKGRAEAFSDGVLAVAITLLALDLHVSTGHGHASLSHQLSSHWPSFAAYVVSFFVIGVIWVNHHALFALISHVDRPLLVYNLMLLMWVTTIPFTTGALADFLRVGGSDGRWAVVLYGASMEGMSISYVLILRRMITHNLLHVPVSAPAGRRAVARFGLGTIAYPVAVVVGIWSPTVMLVAMAALVALLPG